MDKQTPLRDNYISCTEPINPYHGNYVVISLTKPFCLNLPLDKDNLWTVQQPSWRSIGASSPGSQSVTAPSWSDPSRNFVMPTHCVRTWGNCSFWWNPRYYINAFHTNLTPLTRTTKYPEAQMGGQMYLEAVLAGLSADVNGSMPYNYSEYGTLYPFSNPDSYLTNGNEWTRPYWTLPPSEYQYLNRFLSDSPSSGIGRMAGFNMTLFQMVASLQSASPCEYATNHYLTLTLKPLIPYVDLSGCFLNPPGNYHDYTLYGDWDGKYSLESSGWSTPYTSGLPGEQIAVLPAISTDVNSNSTCFRVTLPVQLYTLRPVDKDFTFSLTDISNGAPSYNIYNTQNTLSVNMVVVATKVKGIFWDVHGEPTTADNADSIHFEIEDKNSPVSLLHTFEENVGDKDRPVFCTQTGSLPIGRYDQYTPSLLFTTKCGPGMWTDLSVNQPLPQLYV